jgi:hypothetical protein
MNVVIRGGPIGYMYNRGILLVGKQQSVHFV